MVYGLPVPNHYLSPYSLSQGGEGHLFGYVTAVILSFVLPVFGRDQPHVIAGIT